MFIVQARTSTAKDGSPYVTHRLVESRREGVKVRQKTLLNLGRNFSVDQRDWRLLCQRVDELINGQATLNFLTLPMEIETEARRIAKRLLERRGHTPEISDWETVDIHSAQDIDSRSIGVEHATLEALKILDIPNKLCSLGLNQRQQGCALAMIISRMAQPGL